MTNKQSSLSKNNEKFYFKAKSLEGEINKSSMRQQRGSQANEWLISVLWNIAKLNMGYTQFVLGFSCLKMCSNYCPLMHVRFLM